MLIDLIRTYALPVMAGVSVSSVCLFLFWPAMWRSRAQSRLSEALSGDERYRPVQRGDTPRGQRNIAALLSRLVGRSAIPTERLSRSLQMAGIRGPNAELTYALTKLAATLVLGGGSYAYVDLIADFGTGRSQNILIGLGGAVAGYVLPSILLKNRILKRQQSIQRAWPNALDLLLICVESGMGIDQALRKVADEIGLESVDLAEELTLTVAELSYLPDRRQAFENLSMRTGLDTVKGVVASLKQAERHGTSLGASLRVLSQENRDLRLAAAEKKAAALPPKLTVPMILFFLPVLFAVIITPAAIQIMSM